MIGLALTTLRLNRVQILTTLLLVVALAAVALITGSAGATAISEGQLAPCPAAGCAAITWYYRLFREVLPFLALLPAVIGAFWGAPLISREYETGTAKLAWTQSVSRLEWVLSRMVVLGALLAVCGAILGVAVGYWISVFEAVDAFGASGQVLLFGQIRGWGPLAWLLLAFTLGALCGALLRRAVLAMAVTAMLLLVATVLRNIWIGSVTAGDSLTSTLQVQWTEVITLLTLSVMLTAATGWVVQRARV